MVGLNRWRDGRIEPDWVSGWVRGMSNLGELEPSGVNVNIWDEPSGAAVVRFVTGDLRLGQGDPVEW